TLQIYSFYSCRQMSSSDWLFTIVHELSLGENEGPVHFAVQQTYFLHGGCIISFTGQIIQPHATIHRSQALFCQRDSVFVVTKEPQIKTPIASRLNNCIFVTIPESIPLPQSVYTENYPNIYILCENMFIVITE
ncbi:hypothetical protein PMAYCL1PPCAC_08484, partial [Pristionchus mayeri]